MHQTRRRPNRPSPPIHLKKLYAIKSQALRRKQLPPDTKDSTSYQQGCCCCSLYTGGWVSPFCCCWAVWLWVGWAGCEVGGGSAGSGCCWYCCWAGRARVEPAFKHTTRTNRHMAQFRIKSTDKKRDVPGGGFIVRVLENNFKTYQQTNSHVT